MHRDDTAALLRLAVGSAPAGSVLHDEAEEGVPIRKIVEAIASGFSVPAIAVDQSDIALSHADRP